LNRLEHRFRLLTGGSRTAMPRQQTLRAAVDWSYQYLEPLESLLFRRLCVFSGGLALDSLEAVCCDDRIPPAEALDLLVRLVDKSLVVPEPRRGGSHRYRLLETLIEYGRERLAESGEASDLWRRHAAHFLEVAETATPDRIAEDSDNLAAALEYLRAGHDDAALRLAVALVGYWDSSGRVNEGSERLQALLEVVGGDSNLRARALDGAGWLYLRQSDMGRARVLFGEARDLLAATGDSAELARTLSNLGLATAFSGQFDEARAQLEESLLVGRRVGAGRAVAGALWVLGVIAFFTGDLNEAEQRATESLGLATEAGDSKLAGFLEAALGIVKLERGHPA
jgi:tetratricopeptide (TPR) repeat protein